MLHLRGQTKYQFQHSPKEAAWAFRLILAAVGLVAAGELCCCGGKATAAAISNAPPSPGPSPPGEGREKAPSAGTITNTPSSGSADTNVPQGTLSGSVPSSGKYPRAVKDVFEAQLALARQAISPGSIDGVPGPQTRSALRAFQKKEHLPISGVLDAATKSRLLVTAPPCSAYMVTTNDLMRLQPLSNTWLGKSQQTALDYETILELVAEKGEAHPNLVRRLNPAIDWSNVVAGTTVQLPDVVVSATNAKAAFIALSLADKVLEAFDANTNLLAHFPCSIAQRMEKRPVGELHVAVLAPNPNYTFDPEIFPESAEAQKLKTKLVLPPGPNNPVGVAWIGLDKPGYGIHGTPGPEQVGRTESHGCFRLANWNAEYLLRLVNVGTPVYVEK
jgi:lipoprotein-anchoring transpeptidase ErfK/SrfK